MAQKSLLALGQIYLDTDTDPKLTKGSDFILNTTTTEDGRTGVCVNWKGNERLVSIIGHSNPTTLIGSCVDHARNRIIMFLVSSDANSIQYYDITNAAIGLVILNSSSNLYLNFNVNFPIYNPKLVGDLLYWTDNYNPPRKINYIRAYNYTSNISTSYKYYVLNVDIFKAYKKPLLALTVTQHIVSSTANILRGKSYQWATRAVYTDGEKSVLSLPTSIYYSDIFYYPNGDTKKNYGIDYYTLSGINISNLNNDISLVEVYVRDNELSDWYLIHTENTSTGATTLQFYDTEMRVQADQTDLARPFDFLPQLAGNQELIEKNRIIYENITEGFDPVVVDVETTVVVSNAGLKSTASNGITLVVAGFFTLRFDSYLPNILYGVEVIQHNTSTGEYLTLNGIYVSITGDTETNILNGLLNSLIINGADTHQFSVVTYSGDLVLKSVQNYSVKVIFFRKWFAYDNLKTSFRSLKFGDSYLGSIRYWDSELRFSSENKFAAPIDIPFVWPLTYPEYLNNTMDRYASLSVKIKNIPPTFARYYSLDFTERIHAAYYIQLVALPYDDYFFDAADKCLRIRVNSLINDARDQNPALKINNYVFESGDRIKILEVLSYGNNYTDSNFSNEIVIDVEIKGFEWPNGDTRYAKDQASSPAYILDVDGNKKLSDLSSYIKVNITKNDLITNYGWSDDFLLYPSPFDAPLTILASSIVFEIYRPKKASENPFYFPAKFYEIGNAGTVNAYHKGDTQNQNPANPSGVPAICNVNPGDTWTKLRDCKDIFVCQDDNYSDYYPSIGFGFMSPNFADPNAKKATIKTGLRFSGRLLEETKINQLNTFLYTDLEVLKSEFGTANAIHEVGDVLKVLQDTKETSIYVGRSQVVGADGTPMTINSTKVLDTINRMDESRGTTYPHSVVPHNRDMYYWDGIRGEIIRSAPNGQIPVSEYGMRTFFKNLSGYTDVIGGYDEQNKMVLFTFLGTSPFTIVFHEPSNQWKTFLSFTPSLYISNGIFLATLSANGIWKHNSNNVARCNYYGVKYKQQIHWYANENPAIKKIFKVLGLKTNKAWDVTSISIEADSSYPRGFLSKLMKGHFKLKEGQFWSDILRNMLTTSNTPSNLDLVNGDKMRGFYTKIEMENSEDGEVWIIGAQVNYDPSDKY